MGNSRNGFLIKNTVIFAIGNLATKIINFLMVPLYTNALSTYEYGIIDLIFSICSVVAPLITLNICESVLRFNLDKDVNHNSITKIGLVVLLIGSFFALLIIPISLKYIDIKDYSVDIYMYIIMLSASTIFLYDLRGKEMLGQYCVGSVLNTVLISVFNLVFLLKLHMGVRGYLYAYIFAYFLTTLYAFFIGKIYISIKVKFDINKAKDMLKYSAVLIPNSFMWWIMNSSDHIMVTHMLGAAENGIYAISYKLPTLITTVSQIFVQAWGYSAIKEYGAKDEEEYNNEMLKFMISTVMLCGVGLMTIIKPFLQLYVAPDYFSSWMYTPFLIVGCVYLTIGSFMATSYTVHKDSYGFLFSGILGAITNVLLNFVLIPEIGVYGAAIATCLSYISVFIFRAFHTRKYIRYDAFSKELIIGTTALLISGGLLYSKWYAAKYLQCLILVFVLIYYKHVWIPIIKKMTSHNKY